MTKRQAEVLNFITSYRGQKGYSPSLDEIRKKFKLASVSTAHFHISKLQDLGHLSKEENRPRSIQVFEQETIIKIPLLGTIAAGEPIEAVEEAQDLISIVNPNIKDKQNYYALRVAGDSMMEDGIYDGDIVVIRKQPTAEDGQTVVAIIDDNEATLKKLFREKKRFRLEPRNQSMLPFYRNEVEVRGVVVQIIRNIVANEKRELHKLSKNTYKVIDLFAGIGGIRMGFEEIGSKSVFSSEWDEQAQKTYRANFSELPFGDITKIKPEEIPPFDILLAGFPCQPFSQAGKKLGLADTRGTLFFDIAKIVDHHRPTVVFLENVKRFKSHDGGRTFETIKTILEGLGYEIYAQVLNAKDFGVPQNRERIYIVGFLGKTNFTFPKPSGIKTRLGDILEKEVHPKYTISDKLWAGHQRRKKEHQEKGNGFGYSLFNEDSEYTSTISARYYKDGSEILIEQKGKNPRKLTPREAARLQGFPDHYIVSQSDSQAYKQFGNSVAVPVIKSIAKEIDKALKNLEKNTNQNSKSINLEQIKRDSVARAEKVLAQN